jgi:4-hydroxybenzoate polyprenyltransferase
MKNDIAANPSPSFSFNAYWQLMRFDKPIGVLLLLWPTLWALCLAAGGLPPVKTAIIFILGVFLMRAAGCVINDFADRKIDGQVQRTKTRPIVSGSVSARGAIALFVCLCLCAFALVLMTNTLTVALSFGGVALAFCYPFMKRHTHLPQVVLGAAFAWGIPMAFAAINNSIDPRSWLIYTTVVLWTVVYDTFYAMVDRPDDLKIGVKSTAILFGEGDRLITACLQVMVLMGLIMIGKQFELGFCFEVSVLVVAGLFAWQQKLIKHRHRDDCFKAFLNNNWVGAAVFVGIALDQVFKL